jgi:cap2 methyltransferase
LEWTGLSLNPYYEGNDQDAMVDDDRFIIETLDRWYFGIDNSGNILDPNNIKGLWDRIRVSSLYS